MDEDKVLETVEKAQDWWSEHNFGTRITLVVFLIITFMVVVIPFISPTSTTVIDGKTVVVARDIPHYALILEASFEATLWAFIIVTVGPNTIGKIADAWVKYKGLK